MISGKKGYLIPAGKLIAFVLLFAMLFSYLQYILMPKTSDNKDLYNMTRLPENSVDVFLVGPSHVLSTIQPAQLFGEFGIASVNAASVAQSIPASYYVIQGLLEKQSPKLIVLDLFFLFSPLLAESDARIHQALDHMPLSLNKIEAIQSLAPENKWEFLVPLSYYHSRWDSLTQSDYEIATACAPFSFREGVESFTEPMEILDKSDTAEIADIPLEYLQKIIALCKERDIELLLTVVPYRADVDNNDTAWQYQQQVYNTAALLAEELGVDFLNTLHCLEDTGIDFTTDMMEWSHLNYSGAEKISRYYGNYLREHYDLPDRTEDPAYSLWHHDYEAYLEGLQELKNAAAPKS